MYLVDALDVVAIPVELGKIGRECLGGSASVRFRGLVRLRDLSVIWCGKGILGNDINYQIIVNITNISYGQEISLYSSKLNLKASIKIERKRSKQQHR